jgi:hypothetical protein
MSGAHQLRVSLCDREAMRDHQRISAPVAAGGEQFECASAVGLGATVTAVTVRHGASGGGWIGSVTFRIARHARQRAARASRSGIGLLPRMLPHERAFERRNFKVHQFLTLPEKAFCCQRRGM